MHELTISWLGEASWVALVTWIATTREMIRGYD